MCLLTWTLRIFRRFNSLESFIFVVKLEKLSFALGSHSFKYMTSFYWESGIKYSIKNMLNRLQDTFTINILYFITILFTQYKTVFNLSLTSRQKSHIKKMSVKILYSKWSPHITDWVNYWFFFKITIGMKHWWIISANVSLFTQMFEICFNSEHIGLDQQEASNCLDNTK